MCTVSAVHEKETFHLFFNRDEQLERPEALPPRVWPSQKPGSLPFLAPLDPQGGGSWLAVNSSGLLVGLLNNYETGVVRTQRHPKSRGLLVTQLAPLPSLLEVSSRVANLDLAPYAPFYLFACSPEEYGIFGWSWDGEDLTFHQHTKESWLLTTSSIKGESISSHRRTCFEKTPKDQANLEQLHHTLDLEQPERSFRILREDARTVSISHIDISDTKILFHYQALGGDGPSKRTVHALPRALQV